MATTAKATSKSAKQTKVGSAPSLANLIADAADLKARAAKLLADLLLCKAAGGDNAYGGDTTTTKNPH